MVAVYVRDMITAGRIPGLTLPPHIRLGVIRYDNFPKCDPPADVEDPPDAGDPQSGLGENLWEQRTVRFTANSTNFNAFIITTEAQHVCYPAGRK